MIRLKHSRTAVPLLAALMIAAPARAQTAAGPVRSASMDAARLSAPAALRPFAAGPSMTMDLSRPHLYYSAPLSALMGVSGAVLGYGLGFVLFDCEDEAPQCARGPDDFEYTLAYTGLAVGAATGAHLGGKRHDSKGSFWATLGGAAIGALPVLIAPKDDDQTGAYVGSMAGATAGAVLVDYLVRRPRG